MKFLGADFWIEVLQAFVRVLKRYPLSVISGLAVFISFSIVIKDGIQDEPLLQEQCLRVALTGILGISVFVLIESICERIGGRNTPIGLAVTVLSVISLIGFGLWIPFEEGENIYNRFWIFYAMLLLFSHLGIAVVPFFKIQNSDSILWEYNKVLLSKFLITGFFSAVSFAGMAMALFSIVELFNVDIEEQAYGRIWFFCAFVLNTCLLLGGLPTTAERMALALDYPKWINFLSKFILLPLVILYFGILYVYAAKIVVTWTWPDGMVGLPVLILAGIGGLTALLVWPLSQGSSPSIWAGKFWRFFFPLLLPLSFLLLMALQRRVADYGFTEVRFVGVLAGLWILLISAFYTVRSRASFKFIPWSLMVCILIFSWGPWSPSKVAERSQWSRLQAFLESHGVLVDGTLVSNPQEVSKDEYWNFRSMVRYLAYGYGKSVFEPILNGIEEEKKINLHGTPWSDLNRGAFSFALVDYTGVTTSESTESNSMTIQFERYEPVNVDGGVAIYEVNNLLVVRRSEDFLINVFGEAVKVLKSDSDDAIDFWDSEDQLLGTLSFVDWLTEHDPDEMLVAGVLYQYMNQEELTFVVELKSVGQIEVVARRLDIFKYRGEWSVRDGDFWFLVPSSGSFAD